MPAQKGQRPRSVIVTGGANGLGKIMSAHLASLGDVVTILDIDAANGAAVAAELNSSNNNSQTAREGEEGGESKSGKVSFLKCDISSWSEQAVAFRAVYDAEGRVDVVIANAGISEGSRSWLVPPRATTAMIAEGEIGEPEEPRLKVLDVNLVGNVYSVKLALHYMQRNAPDVTTGGRGVIVCTASNMGLYPFPSQPLYAASKHAVVGLVRSLGPVYGQPHVGIRINALAPSVFATNLGGPDVDVDAILKNMIISPPSTLVAGLDLLLGDASLNGQVAELHGENVTLRPPHEVVDADSQHNLDEFARVGYGQ